MKKLVSLSYFHDFLLQYQSKFHNIIDYILGTLLLLSLIEWSIAGYKMECAGTEKLIGNFADIARCADACKGISTMFIHGRKAENENACFCEISALGNGTCIPKKSPNYNLYRYGDKGNERFFNWYDI